MGESEGFGVIFYICLRAIVQISLGDPSYAGDIFGSTSGSVVGESESNSSRVQQSSVGSSERAAAAHAESSSGVCELAGRMIASQRKAQFETAEDSTVSGLTRLKATIQDSSRVVAQRTRFEQLTSNLISQRAGGSMKMNAATSGWMSSREKTYSRAIQRVRDVDIPEAGICGPAALLAILQNLGAEIENVAAISDVLTGQESTAGSVIGEIFNRAQLSHVVEHFGKTVTYRNFGNVDELWAALVATGGNNVMVAISNVGFDQLARAEMDAALVAAGNEWVRAHWIIVTAIRETAGAEGEAPNRFLTYTESQNRNKREVRLNLLHEANQRLNATWNWGTWAEAYGRDAATDEDVTRARERRGVEAPTPLTEELQLSGYIAEIT